MCSFQAVQQRPVMPVIRCVTWNVNLVNPNGVNKLIYRRIIETMCKVMQCSNDENDGSTEGQQQCDVLAVGLQQICNCWTSDNNMKAWEELILDILTLICSLEVKSVRSTYYKNAGVGLFLYVFHDGVQILDPGNEGTNMVKHVAGPISLVDNFLYPKATVSLAIEYKGNIIALVCSHLPDQNCMGLRDCAIQQAQKYAEPMKGVNLHRFNNVIWMGHLNHRPFTGVDHGVANSKNCLGEANQDECILDDLIESRVTFLPTHRLHAFDPFRKCVTKSIWSWTDRILYKTDSGGLFLPVESSYTDVTTPSNEGVFTDHQAVTMRFLMK